jgi:hypothetical protein
MLATRVQLKVAHSMSYLGGGLGGAGAPAHACFLPETKRARERAFHAFCMPLSIAPSLLLVGIAVVIRMGAAGPMIEYLVPLVVQLLVYPDLRRVVRKHGPLPELSEKHVPGVVRTRH